VQYHHGSWEDPVVDNGTTIKLCMSSTVTAQINYAFKMTNTSEGHGKKEQIREFLSIDLYK
jgi:hypothetical protein